MNIYLTILNWAMAGILVLIWFFLKPIFGLSVFLGALLGGMLTAGVVSWLYHKDKAEGKSKAWQSVFFRKKYLVEGLVELSFLAIASAVALVLPGKCSFFVFGVALMYCANWAIESLYFLLLLALRSSR